MSKRKRSNYDYEENKKQKTLVTLDDFMPKLSDERGKHYHFINNCQELITQCYQRACNGYTFYHFRYSSNLSSLNSVSYMLDLGVFVETDCGWEKSCCSRGPLKKECKNCSSGLTILSWENSDSKFCKYLMDKVINSYVDTYKLDMIIRETNYGNDYVVHNLDLRYNEIQQLKKEGLDVVTEMYKPCYNGCFNPVCKKCLGFTKVTGEPYTRLACN